MDESDDVTASSSSSSSALRTVTRATLRSTARLDCPVVEDWRQRRSVRPHVPDEQSKHSRPCTEEYHALTNTSEVHASLRALYQPLVRRSDCVDVTLGVDSVPSSSVRDQNYVTMSTVDNQQRNRLKRRDEVARATGTCELLQRESDVRSRLHDEAPRDEPAAELSDDDATDALLSLRHGCTWHSDLERNTRIWKLLVSLCRQSLRAAVFNRSPVDSQ